MTAANPHRAARNRGKTWERRVATDLGTKRTGPTGLGDADVIHETLGVECKAYARLMFRAADWLQAKTNAKERVPVLIIKAKGAPASDAIVILPYDYFIKLHTIAEEN